VDQDVRNWLEKLDLGRYGDAFEENELDLDLISDLTDADLKDLGVATMGHRKKLLRAIAMLSPAVPDDVGGTTSGVPISSADVTPQYLAKQILNSRSALEGERKHVTVVFADVQGSTALIEGFDPEQAEKRLAPALQAMIDAVHEFEGTVNKIQGDGIMALFGAPLAHEDHAVRACYAALAIQERLRRLHQTELSVRVGLHSGEVVVRSVNNDLSMDYDAIGPTVHLASRMEQLAAPGTIRLTAATERLADGFVEAQSLGLANVKGLSTPTETFELLAKTGVQTRWEVSSTRTLTRFVGRETEMATLEPILDLAGAGQGQIVAIVGEAGMGKSRLVHEFTSQAERAGWTVRMTGASPHAKNTAFMPIGRLLRSFFGARATDGQETIARSARDRIAMVAPELMPILTPLFSVLDLPVDDPAWAKADPQARRQQIIDAICALAVRRATDVKLLMVFEDLHWIDAETQAVLDSLVEALGAARILLLLTYRPEYRHQWAAKSYYQLVSLTPLQAATAMPLVDALLGRDPSVEPLRPLLIERTEGNPLFLEEMVRSLADGGILQGERGAYVLVQAIDHIDIPESVQSVLAARIDRLAPDLKFLVQTASVIGRELSFDLLFAIADLPADLLRDHLTILQSAEFLYEVQSTSHSTYIFKHALTQDVAYDSLLRDQRLDRHRRIVSAIEKLYADRIEEQIDPLAYHALRGEVWDKAHTYARRAADRALERSANLAALEYYEEALLALRQLPQIPETTAEQIDLHFAVRDVLFMLGRLSEILSHLDQAETLAKTIDDRRRFVQILLYKSGYHWQIGQQDKAVRDGQAALDVGRRERDPEIIALAHYRLGSAKTIQANFVGAIDNFRHARLVLETEIDGDVWQFGGLQRAFCCGFESWCLAELGEFDKAIAIGRAGLDMAEQADHAYTRWAVCGTFLLHTYVRQGRFEEAVVLGKLWSESDKNPEESVGFPWKAAMVAWSNACLGNQSAAEYWIDRAATAWDSGACIAESKNISWVALLWLSEAHRAIGEFGSARSFASQALDLARTRNEPGHVAWAQWLIGMAELSLGDTQAESLIKQFKNAVAAAEERSMRPLIAHCHQSLGTLYTILDQPETADKYRAMARQAFHDMGMMYWLNAVEGSTDGCHSAE
jgi:class 3 adenylate cyclase/tetratricopeptide (TPR) repeat protein